MLHTIKTYSVLILLGLLTSCWAPPCPVRTCHVRLEHKHNDPTGTYQGRLNIVASRYHFLWDKNKSDENAMKQAGDRTKKSPTEKRKKTPKKLFEWERY